MSPTLRVWLGRGARVLLALGLLVWVLGRVAPPPGFLEGALPWVALFALLTGVGACIEAERLRHLFAAQKLAFPFRLGVRLALIGMPFNYAVPGGTGGDLVKLYLLASENAGRRLEIAAILALDRVVALVALVSTAGILGALGALDMPPGPPRTLAGLSMLMAVGGIAGLAIAVFAGHTLERRLGEGMGVRALLRRAAGVAAAYRRHPRAILAAMGLSMLGQLALLGAFAAASRGLLGGPPLLVGAILSGLGLVANGIPVTPGGVGVGELAFQQLLHAAGVGGGALVMLVWRCGAIPGSLLGLWLYAVGVRRDLRALQAHETPLP